MNVAPASFFAGMGHEDVEELLGRLPRRRFPAGSAVIAEGDSTRAIYIIQAGVADVFVDTPSGASHRVNRVGAGATLGEMSLFTGRPASASVRAVTPIDVWVLDEAEFHRVAGAFPCLYRNLGAILSDRLAQSERRGLRTPDGRASVLLDQGAPPGIGRALAGSIAWHTRRPTLLLTIADQPKPDTDAAMMASEFLARLPSPADPRPRAHVVAIRADGSFTLEALVGALEHLKTSYGHILVQVTNGTLASALALPCLRLRGAGGDEGPGLSVLAWSTPSIRRGPDARGVIHVPALTPDEARAVEDGTLDVRSPAGRALGWAARYLAGIRVGLALGAGSAKGYAHLGVLGVLDRIGLSVDCISGTSIGAVVGALHALGYDADEAAEHIDGVAARAFRLHMSSSSLLSNHALRAGIRQVCGETRLEDLPTPLGVVAADLVSRREVIFREGLLWQAVLASISLPGIYPPQCVGPYTLVDGAVVNPVPIDVAAALGADVVITVSLAEGAPGPPLEVEATPATGTKRSFLNTTMRSIDMMYSRIESQACQAATILIEPVGREFDRVGLWNFHSGRRNIARGEAAAEAALPRITAAFPWLLPPEGSP